MLENILKNIDIPDNAQKVYIHLLKHGPMPARLLAQKMATPRPTVYDALNILTNSGMVISREEENKAIFSISDPNSLELLMDQRIENLTKAKSEIKELIPKLRQDSETVEPRIRFFSGPEGVKKILNDILWYRDIETYTLWPMNEMIDLLGEEYLEWLNKRRVAEKIRLKSIRKQGARIDFKLFPYLANKPENLRSLRYAPADFKFEMSYWIYADKVTFISAGAYPFGFIVHSKEFGSMLKAHFDLLWDASKGE